MTRLRFLPVASLLAALCSSPSAWAQNGQFDVRLVLFSNDPGARVAEVDIEVRASSPSTEFRIADQNYRFR